MGADDVLDLLHNRVGDRVDDIDAVARGIGDVDADRAGGSRSAAKASANSGAAHFIIDRIVMAARLLTRVDPSSNYAQSRR